MLENFKIEHFSILSFWYSGILAFWYFGTLTFWHFSILAFWHTAHKGHWNLVCRAALGSWSHYYWTRALLDALEPPRRQMGFSHTSPTATQVLQHRCDQWASVDAVIVRQDSSRASQPQAILKLCPPSSLDYKTRHGPQTVQFFLPYYEIPHTL